MLHIHFCVRLYEWILLKCVDFPWKRSSTHTGACAALLTELVEKPQSVSISGADIDVDETGVCFDVESAGLQNATYNLVGLMCDGV